MVATAAVALLAWGTVASATAGSKRALPIAEPGQAAERALAVAAGASSAAPEQLAATPPIAVPGGGSIHRFRQRLGDLPVLGAEIVVADPADAPPQVVTDETVGGLRPSVPSPSIGRATAIARARSATDAGRLRQPARARLVADRAGHPAWEVRLPAARPVADLMVLVDAASGEVTRVRDLLRRATASALLFAPNPVVSQGTYTGLRDRRDRDSTQLAGLRAAVSLPRIESPGGCLRGTYVVVRLGRREPRNVCNPSFDWTGVQRSANAFEALMAYFHIDRTRAYLDSLGLSQALRERPQSVLANGILADNSFYAPFDRRMTLGTGGVDDGEDADVIVHEYGHAVQDMQARFFGESLEGAAMGEGFGDYLAAVMSALTTGGNATFDPCMFEWDATSYTDNRCARRTDRALTKRRAKRHCWGSPHCMGEAWSAALWELRGALGFDSQARSVGDRVLLESHFMLSRRADFRDGARALLAADQLLYGGVYTATIGAEMVERGFCERPTC